MAPSMGFTSHFPLPPGLLSWAPKEETAGTSFGFSFFGFRFSRLPFCSRFAIALSFTAADDALHAFFRPDAGS